MKFYITRHNEVYYLLIIFSAHTDWKRQMVVTTLIVSQIKQFNKASNITEIFLYILKSSFLTKLERLLFFVCFYMRFI